MKLGGSKQAYGNRLGLTSVIPAVFLGDLGPAFEVELGNNRLQKINELCPEIPIIGIGKLQNP